VVHRLLILDLHLSVLTPLVSSKEHFCSQQTARDLYTSVPLHIYLFKAEFNRLPRASTLGRAEKKRKHAAAKQIMSIVHFSFKVHPITDHIVYIVYHLSSTLGRAVREEEITLKTLPTFNLCTQYKCIF
jgi:hypothetical protein